jgi:hypothetical protein
MWVQLSVKQVPAWNLFGLADLVIAVAGPISVLLHLASLTKKLRRDVLSHDNRAPA